MRVHELAKDLNIQSKEVVEFLATKGIEVKSASGLDEGQIDMVRKNFAKKSEAKPAAKTEAKPAAKAEAKVEAKAEPKAEAKPEAKHADGEQRPKKKSTISAVFNPRYSNNGQRSNNGGQRRRNDLSLIHI